MSDSEQEISHEELARSTLDVEGLLTAGEGSRLYHETGTGEMESRHDGRRKTVLINRGLVPTAGELLVDVVTYEPGVSCPEHYHRGTDHFFYVLEGEGIIEIEGEEFELEQGTVAWVGEGDKHRLYAREDQAGMRLFEYFSNGDHETEFFGEECTWTPDSV